MNETIRPTTLIAATTWWALSARLAGDLLQHGCGVEALCPPGHPLRHLEGVRRYHSYDRVNSLAALRKAIGATRPALVVPCDDGVVRQLHELYQCEPGMRELIARSLGNPSHFKVVESREQLQQVAEQLQIRVPRARRVESVNDVSAWFEQSSDPVVLKRDGTSGGNGVCVVRSATEAAHELTRMLRRMSWPYVCKRAVVDRDPLALWSKKTERPRVTLQEFIPGRPANLMMSCWKGEVLGAVTVEVLWSQGTTGAALIVRLIEHDEIARAACKLAKRLELSGFHGLDFVLKANTGAAYLIEMNPRCTQLGHLPILGQGSLAGLLCRQLGLPPVITPYAGQAASVAIGQTIAFFPKAFCGLATCNYPGEAYQDVPWEHPTLISDLLKSEWPDRQWQARIYHWVRPRTHLGPATFDREAFLDKGRV